MLLRSGKSVKMNNTDANLDQDSQNEENNTASQDDLSSGASSSTNKEQIGIENKNTLSQCSQTSPNESVSVTRDPEPEIVCFTPEMEMKWSAWLTYFNSICREYKKDDLWKIRNIQKFLKGRALTVFVNNCLNVLHWEEVVELFNDEFYIHGEHSLDEFTAIKFNYGTDLNQYYHRKMKIGRELNLDSRIILEGLTDGLPMEIRQLVIANDPKSNSEWRDLVSKLSRLHIGEKSNSYQFRKPVENLNANSFRQWRPPRFSNPSYVPPPRTPQWSYRKPNMPNQSTSYSQNCALNQYRTPRPSIEPKLRTNVHFQETLPPTPCRICSNIGIPNAYHWMRNCPFKRSTVEANQTLPVVQHDQTLSAKATPFNPQSGNDLNEGDSKLF